jgi:thimet oligopeptidase
MASPTAEELRTQTGQVLQRAGRLLTQIERAQPATVENVLQPLNDLLLEIANLSFEGRILAEVHPLKTVREAAEAQVLAADHFRTNLELSRPLYEVLGSLDVETLAPLPARFVELMRRDMRRAGVALKDRQQARVRQLRDELLVVVQEFARNIRDDVRSIALAGLADLEGLPPDYIKAHPPGKDGRIHITTDYPDYIPFMRYARSGAARKALMHAFQNRATPRNLAVLKDMLSKRHELAGLLGYAHWADYATEDKMSGSAAAVERFITRVVEAARPAATEELQELLEWKRRDESTARQIGEWEWQYYIEQIRGESFQFDARALRPYLEYGAVRQAVLDLNSELFGATFTPRPDIRLWHPSVETFDVTVDGRPRGQISLDMHPRAGKFNHAACFTLRPGVGGKQTPHVVLVCNFPDPQQTAPALMEHQEVVTFFHEFGHLMHGIMRGEVPWLLLLRNEWDFVEAPSQFLEEWIFDFDVLRRFARHVETGEAIPVELVERLRAAREFGRGLQVHRLLGPAVVSLRVHDRDPQGLDTGEIVREAFREYTPWEPVPDTHYEASFGHLEDYTALYYTYAWSLVIAKDLRSAFHKGLMDLDQARRYRDLILAPGGSKPAAALVEDFLGRPYGFDAFRIWLAPRAGARVPA